MVTYTDYLNKLLNFVFKGLAYGYVAEILIVLFFLLFLFLLVSLLKDYRIFIFIFLGKLTFAKRYFYYFYMEKVRFLKSFYIVARSQILKVLKIGTLFLIVASLLTWVLISFFN